MRSVGNFRHIGGSSNYVIVEFIGILLWHDSWIVAATMNFPRILPLFFSSFVASVLTRQSITIIDAEGRLEEVRAVMLLALARTGSHRASRHSSLHNEIARAADAQTLWYLRIELLGLLSDCYGELVARKELDAITGLFRGIVSQSQIPGRERGAHHE